jgi:hypothetical protein
MGSVAVPVGLQLLVPVAVLVQPCLVDASFHETRVVANLIFDNVQQLGLAGSGSRARFMTDALGKASSFSKGRRV